ncbi:nucleotidyl transferase AbiEii/AbiGii toxin family protein [Bradyrhizobium sp. WYCCWR 13023]|uniref:Nucleotidyl transferase AbiEii/AbiGii toxin family protein n=1 Tax=Bradyrhizobium zhengyangense TaxID=2911009 RepID=A0A9X1UDZ2_9BRAD|nr:nucleotidyl transferase AbiEii/AbiGii toxin family protein [Bradyrhizobium zhengyangense]MCG2631483.1 nucleotidyl transferase AbiEii/AbiGii toxin family protein [Bradyrhizobium zhengyangense]MCG2643742.1 nucleotidyl transferase AbiEii/AbiGii toxin family protein [Bradyrhizobium zhengyangense]MCG2671343.1 nucleotidyl transferase AbiEii/AbiGii toxin family protein [Bradyrhizobium zhengyangense]
MPDQFLKLSDAERQDALGVASSNSGRPAHLLEKDVWVVWCLNALFTSPLGEHLVFKGGTSLSKVYGAIRRFSEDVDLTYDIRALAPDLVNPTDSNPVPQNRSQGKRWTERVYERLPVWVNEHALPTIEQRLAEDRLSAILKVEGEKLFVAYDPVEQGSGYVGPKVMLEFGARSTGEPSDVHNVVCDAAEYLPGLEFPTARPKTMKAERTFWEKATAIHVFCAQGKLRGERFARHWYDLMRLDQAKIADAALADRDLAKAVAEHKTWFFAAKDSRGEVIDYQKAVNGSLRLVPEGAARLVLEQDYQHMIKDGLLLDDPEEFDVLLERCAALERRANGVP